MSKVNADGVLLDPEEHLRKTALAESAEDSGTRRRRVTAANGESAGTVGGIPHGSAPRS